MSHVEADCKARMVASVLAGFWNSALPNANPARWQCGVGVCSLPTGLVKSVCSQHREGTKPSSRAHTPGPPQLTRNKQKGARKSRDCCPQGFLVMSEGFWVVSQECGRDGLSLVSSGKRSRHCSAPLSTQNSHRNSPASACSGKVGCTPAEFSVATCSQSTQSHDRGFLINTSIQTGFDRIFSSGTWRLGSSASWRGSEMLLRVTVLCVCPSCMWRGAACPRGA